MLSSQNIEPQKSYSNYWNMKKTDPAYRAPPRRSAGSCDYETHRWILLLKLQWRGHALVRHRGPMNQWQLTNLVWIAQQNSASSPWGTDSLRMSAGAEG